MQKDNQSGSCLREFNIFGDLSDDQLARLSTKLTDCHFRKGEVIIKEFDKGNNMFLLLKGDVDISRTLMLRLSKYDYGQRDKVLTRLSSTDRLFFGETGLLGMGDRTATVVAASDCRMMVLEKEDFDELVIEDPEMGYKIVKRICNALSLRLRKANEDVLKLTTALSIAVNR